MLIAIILTATSALVRAAKSREKAGRPGCTSISDAVARAFRPPFLLQRLRPPFAAFATCFLILLFSSLGVQAAEPRRVVLLHSFGREFAPFITFSQNFRTELAQRSPEPVDFFDFALITARFDKSEEAPFIAYLNSLFDERSVDLIVPIGGPAVRFAQKYRPQLFPKVPMLFASVDQHMVQYSSLTPGDAVVALQHDASVVVKSLLRLLPGTTNIAVVFGNTTVGRFWTDQFDRAIKEFAPGVNSELFSQLSDEEMISRVAHLPPHSAIICGQILVDANGIPQIKDALQTLHSVANAPMFGIHDYQLGLGIVGGPLVSIRETSHQSALAAARILSGESPATIRPAPMGAAQPTYDWRELRRWRIPFASLPPDALIQFRDPTPWERYKWHIVTILSICAAQAVLIFLLLTSLGRRRRAEHSLRESEERMSMAADAGRLGMWVWEATDTHFWASEKWKEIHGYSRMETIRYEGWIERVHPEDRPAVEHALAEALKKHTAFHLEHRLLLPGGAIRWMSKTGRVEPTVNGDPVRLLGISIDITERKETETTAREVSGKLITAQEDERKRIARDLHDDLNQRLALLSVETDLLGRMQQGSEARELIGTIASRVSDLSSEVHKLSYQLHPAKLDQLGLVSATRSLCHEVGKQCVISIEFKHDSVPRALDQDVALCLYRIVQEALQNIIKHSRATRADVFLGKEADALRLVVSDNGQGFDTRTARQHAGLGLVGMRERARLVHGEITFDSAPQRGTQIKVTIPSAS